ncbi:hypothetical protein PWG15_19755 [Ensifer adhaerens]|uniref:hypothetical protein n=1 Tax=Ensifer adhaerens TaxID=106592 RepID=UPI0023AA0306|nr:hypothetical protein [Ensifer adhaerens]WDZ76792.1 hypothetical protein PWG15_19755 [Ensifer adhaerens]
MRLDGHNANAIFELHFDLEHTAEIIDGDQRSVAQTAKAFLGHAEFDLGTIAGIAHVVVIVEIIIIIIVVASARAAMMIVAVIIPINAMPVVVVIVTAIVPSVMTAATTIITAVIIIIIIIGKSCGRERMRRTSCDYRQADGCRNEPAQTERGNK